MYCDDCGKNLEHSCKYCEGGLYRNQRLEPKGLYKLPEGMRKLSKAECINKISKDYESGSIVKMEKENWIKLIEELKNNTESWAFMLIPKAKRLLVQMMPVVIAHMEMD
jgi:hypothetical protein